MLHPELARRPSFSYYPWAENTMSRFLNDNDQPFATASFAFGRYVLASQPESSEHAPYNTDSTAWQRQRSIASSDAGLDSSHDSSTASDRHVTPSSPPELGTRPHPLPTIHVDEIPYVGRGYITNTHHDQYEQQHSCVTLNQVQHHADEYPEPVTFPDDGPWPHYYPDYQGQPEEGFHPLPEHDSLPRTVETRGFSELPSSPSTPPRDTIEPNYRHRRTVSSGNVATTRRLSSGKVAKRPSMGRRASSTRSESAKQGPSSIADRVYLCPLVVYGCQSTFANKNEWKRHVTTQHMRPTFWRCVQCSGTGRKPNDFNRKDLFVQHVRRMHPLNPPSPKDKARVPKVLPEEETYLQEEAAKCLIQRRPLPESSCCPMCSKQFNSWDERMEHIGRHMEDSKKPGVPSVNPRDWRTDDDVERWMINERIIALSNGAWVLSEPRHTASST